MLESRGGNNNGLLRLLFELLGSEAEVFLGEGVVSRLLLILILSGMIEAVVGVAVVARNIRDGGNLVIDVHSVLLLLLLLFEHIEPLLLLLLLENSSGDGSIRVVVVVVVIVVVLTSNRSQRRSCIVGVVEEAGAVVQADLGFCLADLRSGAELSVVVGTLGDGQLELFLVRFLKMR